MAEEEMTEVFRSSDPAVIQFAVDEVLNQAEIPSEVHNRSSSVFPTPNATPGAIFIAVPKDLAGEACDLLRDAQFEGALSDNCDIANFTDEGEEASAE